MGATSFVNVASAPRSAAAAGNATSTAAASATATNSILTGPATISSLATDSSLSPCFPILASLRLQSRAAPPQGHPAAGD